MDEFNRDNSATIAQLVRERDEALAEVERLRADAERWRYARLNLSPAACVNCGWPSLGDLPPDEAIEERLDRMADAAIDAAIEGE